MPFVNYQRRPLVFNEMGKPINDLSMEDAIKKAKPAASKGQYFKSVTLASTMSPGVKVNPGKI